MVLIVAVVCKLIARRQKKPLELVYSKKNALMNEFYEKSDIAKMEFEPYTFGVTPILQTLIFLFIEAQDHLFYHDAFSLELVKLPDGGTIGLDWDGEVPDPTKHPEKPILVMVPGVAGGSNNLYQLALIR